VSDLQRGTVSGLQSRTPATTIQSMLQEGNTRFDLSIKDLRQSSLSEVGLRVLQNLQVQVRDTVNNPAVAVLIGENMQLGAALFLIFGLLIAWLFHQKAYEPIRRRIARDVGINQHVVANVAHAEDHVLVVHINSPAVVVNAIRCDRRTRANLCPACRFTNL